MKYCPNCGNQVDENAIVCLQCGCALPHPQPPKSVEQDESNIGMAILGFFIPIVGFILYLIWHSDYPKKAKSAGTGALIGFGVSFVISILYGVIVGSMISSLLYF